MRFEMPLIEGRLIQRYKRFLADIALPDGSIVTAHCANPGAMLGLKEPGSRVLLSRSGNPARKLAFDWEFVEAAPGGVLQWIGINTMRPNKLVAEALREKRIPALTGYGTIRAEVKYGAASRVDFLLTEPGEPPCYLEIKNCHLMREAGLAEFPDCVAARSARHMQELAAMKRTGARAVILYVVQMRAERFDIARDIDPACDRAFRDGLAAGVEAFAFTCRISGSEIVLDREIPVITPAAASRK